MTRQEPLAMAGDIAPLDPSEHRHPGPGLRIGPPRGGLEQQGCAIVAGEIAGVLGKTGQQQKGAAVAVAGHRHQRHVRPAIVARERRRQGRRTGAPHQPAGGERHHLPASRRGSTASAPVATQPTGSIDGVIAFSLPSSVPSSGAATLSARRGPGRIPRTTTHMMGKTPANATGPKPASTRTSPLCFAFSGGANPKTPLSLLHSPRETVRKQRE